MLKRKYKYKNKKEIEEMSILLSLFLYCNGIFCRTLLKQRIVRSGQKLVTIAICQLRFMPSCIQVIRILIN